MEGFASSLKELEGQKDIDIKKATDGMPVPLHPGAQKYFKEKGIIK